MKKKHGLIKSALYSSEVSELHMARDNPEEWGIDTSWEHLAERIRKIDPDGRRSLALLREMEAKSKRKRTKNHE